MNIFYGFVMGLAFLCHIVFFYIPTLVMHIGQRIFYISDLILIRAVKPV